jgi:uncharacterized membrane protein
MTKLKLKWQTELPLWLILGGMFLLATLSWSGAPAQIPVHWNMAGEIDRYGGKLEGLLAIPFMAMGIYILMLLIPRFDPGRTNYPRFLGAYTTIRYAILVFLALIYGVIHMSIRGHQIAVGTVVPALVGGLLIVMGNVMGKIRPNWFVGVRTPWTLSSKTAWVKTHRLAGWLFILTGLMLLGVSIFQPHWGEELIVGSVIAIVLTTGIYSYLIWRHDPEKVPPAGTSPADDA